jgi:integrase
VSSSPTLSLSVLAIPISRARASGYGTITTHVLRHAAASLWVKAGATPFLVMKAGGWASLDMVSKVYGHPWPSDVVGLGRKVDALDWAARD